MRILLVEPPLGSGFAKSTPHKARAR